MFSFIVSFGLIDLIFKDTTSLIVDYGVRELCAITIDEVI